MKPIILTMGEPAGIGLEIAIKLATQGMSQPIPWAICVDPALIEQKYNDLKRSKQHLHEHVSTLNIIEYEHNKINKSYPERGDIWCVKDDNLSLDFVKTGHPSKRTARRVLNNIEKVVNLCLQGKFSAIVTLPVQKNVLREIDRYFIGHTEYIAKIAKCDCPVMMLKNDEIKVALATTHLALSKVSENISTNSIKTIVNILNEDMNKYFNVAKPKIYVCGLNPHAGENGCLGTEEIDIINPAIKCLKEQGIFVKGPCAADSIFSIVKKDQDSIVLAMYHDQGLPVVKYKSLNKVVNITLGLPFIRTSVGHGTALDLAGTFNASCESLRAAIKEAFYMYKNYEKHRLQSP